MELEVQNSNIRFMIALSTVEDKIDPAVERDTLRRLSTSRIFVEVPSIEPENRLMLAVSKDAVNRFQAELNGAKREKKEAVQEDRGLDFGAGRRLQFLPFVSVAEI